MIMLINTSRSTNILAEATARAVQRIPDAKCNGDMTAALEASAKCHKDEEAFLASEEGKKVTDIAYVKKLEEAEEIIVNNISE